MMFRNFYLAAGALSLFPFVNAQASDLSRNQSKPNIVFIMADDLGWNDLGYTGSDYHETPNIDYLASEGMIFTDAYSAAANSAPSRACFMSGMYTSRHGVFTVGSSARGNKKKRKLIPVENTEDLRADFITLGEALKAQGYTCGHIGKWHLGDDSDGTGPLSQGFDLNIAGCRAGTPYSYFYPYCSKKKGACHPGLEQGKVGEYLTDRLSDEAVQFLIDSSKGGRPFFLYMAHHAVHVPLKAPANLTEKYLGKQRGKYHHNPVYAAMMESLDNSVGHICHTLDSLGIADNTIIIFTSDNGGSEPVTDNFMLRGGKGMPYEGGIRVPLIVKWPGHTKAGSKCDVAVNGIDFYPTLVRIAGRKAGQTLDGEDISCLFEGDDKNFKSRDLFWHFPAYLEANRKSGMNFRATPYSIVRSGEWKLIYFYETSEVELYNLKKDVMETQNVAEKYPRLANELEKKLKRWIADTDAFVPTEKNPDYEAIEK